MLLLLLLKFFPFFPPSRVFFSLLNRACYSFFSFNENRSSFPPPLSRLSLSLSLFLSLRNGEIERSKVQLNNKKLFMSKPLFSFLFNTKQKRKNTHYSEKKEILSLSLFLPSSHKHKHIYKYTFTHTCIIFFSKYKDLLSKITLSLLV